MFKNQETQQDTDTQFVITISSSPFSMEITENGETREVSAQMTNDRRYEFSQTIPADADWQVRR